MRELRFVTTDGQPGTLAGEAADGLAGMLRGELIHPESRDYDEARRVWNGNIDRRPALIARCAGVSDVITALRFAREHDVRVAVRSGAHNAAGHGTCDDGLVIDLSRMKGARVDVREKVADAQAGLLWGEFDAETQPFGLATTGGVVSNTGIAGLTLGGGLGWLMGKHGLTVDNVLSVDLVTADCTYLTASAEQHSDLFWGLRGAGSNFGIATGFRYRLHEIESAVLGGMIVYPIDRAREVLRFYRDFSASLPDEAELNAALATSPDGDPIAVLMPGYNGPYGDGERLFAEVLSFGAPLANMVRPMPYAARNRIQDEPNAIHGIHRYWKSGYTEALSDELIDILADAAASPISPLTGMVFFRIHGAATRVPSDATAFGVRRQQWDFNIVSQWRDEAQSAEQIQWTRDLWARIEPLISNSAYLNHLAADDSPEKVRASFGVGYDRLVDLKRRYDPSNVFRLNNNIPPTRPDACH